MTSPLVPDDFVVPRELRTADFRLEPLGPQHNAADHAAWTTSVAHIRATPGFAASSWPTDAMSLDDNRRDLEKHAADFAARRGFTYTVKDPATDDVIGCVYLYPARTPDHDVDARSWVSAERADLDAPLCRAVSRWLRDDWPFERPDYAARG